MRRFLKELGKTWYKIASPIYYSGLFFGYLTCANKDHTINSTDIKDAALFILLAAVIILFCSLLTLIINALTDKYEN